jgi:type II secretory pathway pseudopilin PulG
MSRVERRASNASVRLAKAVGARRSALDARPKAAFTLIEIMVVMALLSLIVIALMGVFSSTQTAFRASITQTDVLEGGRAAMDMIAGDLKEASASGGLMGSGGVNFAVAPTNGYVLVQSLVGSQQSRTNILEKIFILSRENQTWNGVGYVVDFASTASINPLYRFSASTNAAVDPRKLYNLFISTPAASMSHLLDGVVDLRVHAFDLNGKRIDYYYNTNFNNIVFFPLLPDDAEGELYMFSNMLPASLEIQMTTLEDRTLQRAASFGDTFQSYSNYLSQQAGKAHVFRQRVAIPNVDPAAYQ